MTAPTYYEQLLARPPAHLMECLLAQNARDPDPAALAWIEAHVQMLSEWASDRDADGLSLPWIVLHADLADVPNHCANDAVVDRCDALDEAFTAVARLAQAFRMGFVASHEVMPRT